ncbi:MAG TPA: hypothetical protein PLO14_12700 [Accumulibacter sp.]|nr:hypothetical protein [Accumulibacter sp.]
MQTQFEQDTQPCFPIQELEQIEAAIQAAMRWLATLKEGLNKIPETGSFLGAPADFS